MTDLRAAQRSLAGGEASPLLKWRADLARHAISLEEVFNYIVLAQGVATRRPGSRFMGATKTGTVRTRLLPFVYSTEQAYVLEFGNQTLRFWTQNGQLEDMGSPVELATPYLESELSGIWYAQSADTLYISHENHPTKELRRVTATSFELVDFAAQNGPFLPPNVDESVTMKASAATGTGITLTASADVFTADHVGSLWRLAESDLSLVPEWVGGTGFTYDVDYKVRAGGHVYIATNNGKEPGPNPPTHDEGSVQAGPDNTTWAYEHSGFGLVEITAVASGTSATANVISKIPEACVDPNTTYKWSEGAWSDVRGYPAVCGFFQQRLCFGRTLYQPQTVWLSSIDDYPNFLEGTPATASFSLTFVSTTNEVNAIRWLMGSSRALLIGTAGEEFALQASDRREALTASNFTYDPVSNEGSAAIRPVRADSLVAVSDDGRELVEYRYDFAEDKQIPGILTIAAEHILGDGIVDMAWARRPYRVLWCVLEGGTLAAFTFNRRQEVLAWHRHEIAGGEAESVAVIPSADGKTREVWVSVKRTIDGATVRYLEKLQEPFGRLTPSARVTENAWFLDSALRYEGAAADTISGLDHLEGETVGVLADGKVQPDQVVAGGSITIPVEAEKILVGLNYESRLKTLPFEQDLRDGAMHGRLRDISTAVVAYHETVGGEVRNAAAPTWALLNPSGGGVMDAAEPIMSGSKEVKIEGAPDNAAQVEVRQTQPLPMTVLAMTRSIDVMEGA